MKRLRGIGAAALACVLALGAFSPAMAHGRPGGPGREEGRFGGGMMGMMRWVSPWTLDGLNLTAEQREKARELFREARGDRGKERDGSLRDLMRDLRYGTKPDPSGRKKIADEMTGRILDSTRTLSKLYAILDPEQRDLFQRKMGKLQDFEGHGKNRPGWAEDRFSERLNLTEAQKARAEVLFKSWEKPQAARQKEIFGLSREIGRKAFSAAPDTRRLEADARKLADLAVDGLFERARQREQFRSMLTDEQKKILDGGPMGQSPGKRAW
jgi:Spy/CpxP family protein refolding chaperone